ncbi:MAG: transcription termination factor Rho [Methylacidiphilales bacterium]|nr:transcription termination factor Rho [Candidatus Methylacidiphilales bacterium]
MEGGIGELREVLPVGGTFSLMSDSSPVAGILEIHDKGYGFLRKPERGSAPTPQDVFVPPDMIKRNALRDGVQLSGMSVSNGRGPQLIELQQVNDRAVDLYRDQLPFEELTTINPNRWIKLETGADKLSARVLDLMTPIGHGQRGLIVASPRSGKTMLMQAIADAVLINSPDTFVMIVLIDERPEEVTDFRQFLAGRGEIWSSSNDQENASHVRLAKLVIERAKRLVESGRDVFILLDSITRLGRAFNVGSKGNTMSGGISARALEIPRKIFAAARQTEEAGALTIVATALIDTGSRMDEVIFQEFKGTGNMEIVLDRRLAEARVYPSIDIEKSGTRREELLLPKAILDKVTIIRRGLHGLPVQAQMERLLMILKKFPDNKTALEQLPARPAT